MVIEIVRSFWRLNHRFLVYPSLFEVYISIVEVVGELEEFWRGFARIPRFIL